jgi:hypothetical protein
MFGINELHALQTLAVVKRMGYRPMLSCAFNQSNRLSRAVQNARVPNNG